MADKSCKRKAVATDTLVPTFAGAAAMSVVMYPVDVIRALCMSNPGLSAKEALIGFLNSHGAIGFATQGMAVEVLRYSLARGIKFWIQPLAHEVFFGPEKQGTYITKGASGVIAVFPEVWAISAMENIKLAQQLDTDRKFKGAADVIRHLFRTRGIFGGLYCGYFGMQLRQCLFTGSTFLTFDLCKDAIRSSGISNPTVVDIFGGFMSGVFGVALNCWTDVVRSVIQKKQIQASFDPSISRPPPLEPLNPVPFFRETANIMNSTGMAGLYAGVWPKMIHLGIGNAILFCLMSRFKKMWFEYKSLY